MTKGTERFKVPERRRMKSMLALLYIVRVAPLDYNGHYRITCNTGF
jgi:hypothetical protein